MTTPEDIYQARYLEHQQRKSAVLAKLLTERHSERMFADKVVSDTLLEELEGAAHYAPSSCNRRAVIMNRYVDRDTKALLGGLLVGGVGWIHRAPAIFLLTADQDAYRAEGEIAYMPYLDAGVIVGQLGLVVASLDLVGTFVNPNIRERHRPLFEARFGDDLFCGAFAVGHPRSGEPPR